MFRPIFPLIAIALFPALAHAMDKQGSAHAGETERTTTGVAVSGSLMLGSSLYNPSYAARPDNTGLALMRYAAHADLDLIGERLSIPLDLNMFTDRERSGLGKIAPSEFDVITGLTTTWAAGPGAIEFGSRVERDRPVDRGNASQTYVDARARYVYSLAAIVPALQSALHDGDMTGWLGLGWFAYNPAYYARPDNTGRALLRYSAHLQISIFNSLLALGLDTTFFTDRQADNVIRPSELDFTPELVLHHGNFEAHLAFETDRPIDRSGKVQQFVYVLAAWSFSLIGR